MKLQIVLDGEILAESLLQAKMALSDEEGVTHAMREALRTLLEKDILTPSQAPRVKFRVVEDDGIEAKPWVIG